MIWLVFGALTLGAIAVVVQPLLSRRGGRSEASEVAVYREQLKEIDNDLERGLISPSEADAARAEIKRRILAAPSQLSQLLPDAPLRNGAIASAGIGVVGFCVMIYLALGNPDVPSRPYDAQSVAVAQRAVQEAREKALVRQVEAMIAGFELRVKENPSDAKTWRLLGWTFLQVGRVKQGVDALARAVAIDPKSADLQSQYGEALVRAAEGQVTAEARKAFDAALALDAKDARARFHRGLTLVQSGKENEALAIWAQIIRDGPKDAAWMASVRAQAHALAVKLKLDPQKVLP